MPPHSIGISFSSGSLLFQHSVAPKLMMGRDRHGEAVNCSWADHRSHSTPNLLYPWAILGRPRAVSVPWSLCLGVSHDLFAPSGSLSEECRLKDMRQDGFPKGHVGT